MSSVVGGAESLGVNRSFLSRRHIARVHLQAWIFDYDGSPQRCVGGTTWHRFCVLRPPVPKVSPKVSLSHLPERSGLLHTVDWPENSRESKKRVAGYILCGVFLCQRTAFNFLHILIFVCPCLGLFVMICPTQCSADAMRASLAALCGTTRFWSLPVLTYIVVRSLRMNGCMSAVFIPLLFAK